MTNKTQKNLTAIQIERHILLVRGEKVMLDTDLATLYEVETRILTQAVKRNMDHFPADFMFQLNKEEFDHLRLQSATSSEDSTVLRSQSVILKNGRGKHRKYLPYVFTEQGVAMLSSVLRSKRAVQVNIEIMRAFVRLRQILASNKNLAQQLRDMEQKYDKQFKVVFDAIHQLMMPPDNTKKRPVGFIWEDEKK